MKGRSAWNWLVHHTAIARQFLRIGLIRKSQFRVEFLSQVVMDTIWYLFHVLTFEVLFLHTPAIAGWTRPEIRVFLGMLFVSDAFMMMWLGQGWHFSADLKNGNLDPVRVRPASAVFLYFFQRFSLEATFNMAIAICYLAYALHCAGRLASPLTFVLVPWAFLLAFWGRTVLSVLFSIWEFHYLNADLANFSQEFFGAAIDRPMDIWPQRVRRFLIDFLPLGACCHLPAALLLGRVRIAAMLFHSAWLSLLGVLVFAWWKRSFRHYESSLG